MLSRSYPRGGMPAGPSSFENVISRARILGQIDKSTMTTIFNSRVGPTVSGFLCALDTPPTKNLDPPPRPGSWARSDGISRQYQTNPTEPTSQRWRRTGRRDRKRGTRAEKPPRRWLDLRRALHPALWECHLRSPRTIRRARGVARVGQPPSQPAAGQK